MEDEKAESFEYQSVQTLKGVGQVVAEKLQRLEMYCFTCRYDTKTVQKSPRSVPCNWGSRRWSKARLIRHG